MTRDVIWWPPEAQEEAARVAVVTVSYNTRDLTALLLWSLYRVLEWRALDVVVVDNGSTDGSAELLAQARDAGLCDLIANDANVFHGPALNQALSWLAGRGPSAQWIWVLDSDCVIARPDTLHAALSAVEGSDPALVGEPGWDPWHQCETLGLYSLLLRPALVWRPPLTPFSGGGNPIHDMLISAKAAGLVTEPFGFTADGYVIHLGRGSLAAVAASEERTNPLYAWARDHHEPHFGNVPGASERYRDLVAAFRSDVGTVTGNSLVASCLGHSPVVRTEDTDRSRRAPNVGIAHNHGTDFVRPRHRTLPAPWPRRHWSGRRRTDRAADVDGRNVAAFPFASQWVGGRHSGGGRISEWSMCV